MIEDLHNLFNRLKRYTYPCDNFLNEIPKNGIYVKFEVGERFQNFDRIVRVGTDTGEFQLHSRLFQHFKNPNHRRSIFRGHIGRCFLAMRKDEYLERWNLRFTSRADKEKNCQFVDLDYETSIESEVSSYIQRNISFCVFEMNDSGDRLFWESKIIATLAQSNIRHSDNWLGKHSPKSKIRESGLWHIQGLKKPRLTEAEFERLKKLVFG